MIMIAIVNSKSKRQQDAGHKRRRIGSKRQLFGLEKTGKVFKNMLEHEQARRSAHTPRSTSRRSSNQNGGVATKSPMASESRT